MSSIVAIDAAYEKRRYPLPAAPKHDPPKHATPASSSKNRASALSSGVIREILGKA